MAPGMALMLLKNPHAMDWTCIHTFLMAGSACTREIVESINVSFFFYINHKHTYSMLIFIHRFSHLHKILTMLFGILTYVNINTKKYFLNIYFLQTLVGRKAAINAYGLTEASGRVFWRNENVDGSLGEVIPTMKAKVCYILNYFHTSKIKLNDIHVQVHLNKIPVKLEYGYNIRSKHPFEF